MGGMGAVYVAEQLSTGRKRALKLLLPSLIANERSRERFEQEARVGSRIQSDHVVEVVAAGVDATTGAPWLAMELLEGETLGGRIARAGQLAPAETLEVVRQLCHALGAAHALGVVHRDIKPENVYLATPRREGIPFTLKILDFGIAKLTEDVRGQASATGAIGSPLWMAPEQASSAGVGPSADVWAIGLVVFHCLTGRHYWRSATGAEATLQGLLKEVMFDPLVPASARAAELGIAGWLPAGFDEWFAHAVVREPSQRFPDAAHCLAALQPVLDPQARQVASVPAAFATSAPQTSTAPMPARETKMLPWLMGGVAVLLLGGLAFLVLGGAAFGYFYTREEPRAATSGSAAPLATPTATAPAAPGQSAQPEKTVTPTAKRKPGEPTPALTVGADAGPAPAATPSSTAVAMNEVSDHPPRDYKLAFYKQKINTCWKGNEGAKADAGAYSVTITVKLNELGQAQSIVVSPRTHKFFAGCAVIRSSEHPWGKGPPETKSFAFSF